ncbi:MAG: hypothetical protein ACOCP4_05535 [Candidatus Woesearchaeota archaeon]
MNYYENIFMLTNENNWIITSQMLKDRGFPSVYLTRNVNEGNLQRIDKVSIAMKKYCLMNTSTIRKKSKSNLFFFFCALSS